MRTLPLLIFALLLCACPRGKGPNDASLDADINAMRDSVIAEWQALADGPPPKDLERTQFRAVLIETMPERAKAWRRAVEDVRPDLRRIAASNWALSTQDRHRLLRGKATERFNAIAGY